MVVETPTGGVLLQCLGLYSAMILIGVATSFLVRKISSGYQLAEKSHQDFIILSNRQKAVFDELPDGVITTSLDDIVITVNNAASSLLRLPADEIVGQTSTFVLERLKDKFKLEGEFNKNVDSGEFSLTFPESEVPVQIKYRSREVTDHEGNKNGVMFMFQDITHLRSIEEQLAMQERMARLLSNIQDSSLPAATKLDGFIGESPLMQKIFQLIERVAPSDATVLIGGESGTGKELVAKALHLGGPRANGPFVPVNCGAIPENLIESELFGHKRGAFTGADSDHIGLFRRANRGTIFLDEIGELPLQMQAKLLRALQEKCVRPVGSENTVPVQIRIIAATNKNLKKSVEEKKFREDLYYRLNVINITLPALRERKSDIPLLIQAFLNNSTKGAEVPVITPAAIKTLMDYNYPGNVRELENIIERALVLGGDAILHEHLPDSLKENKIPLVNKDSFETQILIDESIEFPINLDDFLATIEKQYLEVALVKSDGVKKRAAELLSMNFRSFRYRLQKFGIGEG